MRLFTEAAIMSVLESPSLVHHHETFLDKRVLMIVMDFCSLGSLRSGLQALHVCHIGSKHASSFSYTWVQGGAELD